MRIGNRNFPYPVLNANQDLSGYRPNCLFRQNFDVDDQGSPVNDGHNLILKNAHYVLLDTYLNKLCSEGLVKGAFIVECASGCFRNSFPATSTPQDIAIPVGCLKGTVTVSCYLYAAVDIESFAPTQLLPVYDGLSFRIDKFDIIAADDGIDFNVDIDESKDDRTASIFTIVKKDTLDSLVKYESRPRNIIIQLPEEQYACYDNMKMHSAYNDISFSMIAIPALAGCLSDVREEMIANGEEDLDEALDRWNWLNAVMLSYKRALDKELDFEAFVSTPPFELAQTVLNNASCKGLTIFNDILVGGLQESEDESGADDGND